MLKIDDIIDDSEKRLRDQIKLYTSEWGKILAVAVFGLFTLIGTGNELAASDLIPIIYAIPFSILGIILSFWVWRSRQKEVARKDGLKSIAITLNKLQNQITTNEKRYEERLKIWEKNTTDAVYEYSFLSGLFVSVNDNYLKLMGYKNLTDLNSRLLMVPEDERPALLNEITVHPDFRAVMHDIIRKRRDGSLHESNLENVWLLRKDGSSFPANLRVTAIKNNGSWVTQGYISSIHETRSLTERIEALEDLVQEVVGAWSKKRTRQVKIKAYTDFLRKRVEVLKHE